MLHAKNLQKYRLDRILELLQQLQICLRVTKSDPQGAPGRQRVAYVPRLGGPRHADFPVKIQSGWPLALLAISISSARLALGLRGRLSGSVSMLAHQNRRSKREMQV